MVNGIGVGMQRLSFWRIAVGAGVVGLLAVGITVSGPVAAQSRSASAPRCAPAALRVWGGPSTGAAGSIIAEFGFTNRSTGTCFLHGYPRVQMLKKSGTNLSSSDRKAPGAFGIRAKTVVLAPDKTAYFGIAYASQTGYANLTCPTSAALKFTPPQDAGTVTLRGSAAHIQPYGGTTQHLDCGIVHLTAVTARRFQ
ncbi:MAG TPA: DUF4232 domain-containing protein [Acidimicrobiales bacterium]|nr:DUF4232 domain-containing protein [Acidimicrobiales bacterium]